ncbi:8881_t:CDS:2 [Entrophospora sp. SA101]|nr:8881_t:CDS:2 [Entrophospora sp. SA101]
MGIVANVPTLKNPEDVIIEVGPTNEIVYISDVLNEISSTTNSTSIDKNIFKNGTLFEHIISLPPKIESGKEGSGSDNNIENDI